jgi:hypothetical protein
MFATAVLFDGMTCQLLLVTGYLDFHHVHCEICVGILAACDFQSCGAASP